MLYCSCNLPFGCWLSTFINKNWTDYYFYHLSAGHILLYTWNKTLSRVIIIIIIYFCLLSQTFSSWYFSWTNSRPLRSLFKFHTAVLPVLHVIFQVQLSFVDSFLYVFLVWLTNFSLNLLLPFRWPRLLLVYPYISRSTFVVSLYINSYFSSFPASFSVTFPVRWYRHFYYKVCVLFYYYYYST